VLFDVRAEQFAYYGRDLTARVDDGAIELLTGPDAASLQSVTLTIQTA
jgi:beta-glucosidase